MKDVGKTATANRIIQSPYFGELSIAPENIYYFQDGLMGFEDLKEYVLISDEKIEPFKWLLAVEEPTLSFSVINPWLVCTDYKPGKRLIAENISVFVIVTLKNKDNAITANLKAPVVFDNATKTGKQEILTADKYQTNFEIINSNS